MCWVERAYILKGDIRVTAVDNRRWRLYWTRRANRPVVLSCRMSSEREKEILTGHLHLANGDHSHCSRNQTCAEALDSSMIHLTFWVIITYQCFYESLPSSFVKSYRKTTQESVKSVLRAIPSALTATSQLRTASISLLVPELAKS